MIVTQKLMISQKECFDTIIQSVQHEIKQVKNKTITVAKLNGYSYQRTMSNGVVTTTTITDVIPSSKYQFQTKSRLNTHTTTYSIKALTDHTCEVTYDEQIEAKTTTQKFNNIIVMFLFGIFRKKRVKNLLKAIEMSVINQNKVAKTVE